MKARLLLFAAALLFGLVPCLSLRAQTAAPATTTPTAQELQQLVTTLKDDKARAQLLSQLQALIAAQSAQRNEQQTSPLSWFGDLPAQLDSLGADVLSAVPVFVDAPRFVAWIERQVADPQHRAFWTEVFSKLALIFGAGFVAGAVARLILHPAAKRLAAPSHAGLGIRLLILA